MNVSAAHDDWHDIVCCGLENQQIDFKSHQNWDTIGRVGRAKFARHAMALANTLGGYVVIGVSEDENGNPTDYTGMTEEEASSFDPSTVGQTINTFADPPVSLDIVRPVLDGRRYVILVVYPFTDIPHVCSENCEHELQRGGFYIRTPDARSKLAVRAFELHQLIRRALRNQRQMLGRMLRGILYEDRTTDPQAGELTAPLIERSRRQAAAHIGQKRLQSSPCFEAVAYAGTPMAPLPLAELRRAVNELERPSLADISTCSVTPSVQEIFATNESLCGVFRTAGIPFAYWEIYCSGVFFITAAFPQLPQNAIESAQLSRTLLLTLAAIGQLYSLLELPDALLNIAVRISNTENVKLLHVPSAKASASCTCRIQNVEVSCQRSPADLENGAAPETAALLFSEICQRFNAPLDQNAIAELQQSFEASLRS